MATSITLREAITKVKGVGKLFIPGGTILMESGTVIRATENRSGTEILIEIVPKKGKKIRIAETKLWDMRAIINT